MYKNILVKWVVFSSIFIPLRHSKYKCTKNRRKKAQGNRKQVKNTLSAKILSQKSGNYTSCHTSLESLENT